MHAEYGVATWTSSRWRSGAEAWLDDQLAKAGIVRTGEVTQPRVRPWGTVLRAPTTIGTVWLKAPGRLTVFEVGLYELLTRVAGRWVLEPIAADVERGLILLPDGGTPMREQLDGADLVETLVEVLPQYGQLQRELMPHVNELLTVGVADMRPPRMPQRFDEAVEAVEQYVAECGTADERRDLEAVKAKRDLYVDWCGRLEQLAAVPASRDHNDLHLANVFMAKGQAKFYDWGDAVVAHPFASMLMGLGIIGLVRGVGADSPEVTRARDAYLEVFGDLAGHDDLVAELELAVWVSKPARALVWERAIRAHEGDDPGDFANAPLETMCGLLRDSWLAMS